MRDLTTLRRTHAPERLWEGSQHEWLAKLPYDEQQVFGARLVAGWCAAKGSDVIGSDDDEADRFINGRRVEIKFSTLWETGVYTFQQLRQQNYEYAICLGVSPFTASCWVISKNALKRHVLGHTPQHAGRRGRDTYWLSVRPEDPPSWLRECGGTLAAAYEIIRNWRT